MRFSFKFLLFITLLFIISVSAVIHPSSAQASAASDDTIYINNWEMKWETNPDATIEDIMSGDQAEGWFPVAYGDEAPITPEDSKVAWVRLSLPDFEHKRAVLHIGQLIAKDVSIFLDGKRIYHSHRNYTYNKNEILLPLESDEKNKIVYFRLETSENLLEIRGQITLGEFQNLINDFMKLGIFDVILGAALVFIAIAMFVSVLFVKKSYLVGWNSLSTVILSIGLMILTYSPFTHSVIGEYGEFAYYLFDVASTFLMPSLFFYFERVFGKGPFGIIYKVRKIHIILAAINLLFFFIGFASDTIRDWYLMVGFVVFGGFIIVSSLLLIGLLVMFVKQKNKDAIIISIGASIFTLLGASEVVRFFSYGIGYYLFTWKWGALCFITSLIIILVRKIMINYEQVVKYSKQLEVFNNELQRSEKMEMISQLAASVAHEVRNPLQVTRGFLQLIGEKSSNEKDKTYMGLAIEELDRASEIITDFLTFAKPQGEQTNVLNLTHELNQIGGILIPLATMQGGTIMTAVTPDLYIRGNSSKFKQALINIIKNSIEAFGEDGRIDISAYKDETLNEIIIRIKDNGEGISEADLKRLGEPYYSKKTKGTGLGLMVTFRIIELMNGRVEYFSKKGEGTEAVISLPVINE